MFTVCISPFSDGKAGHPFPDGAGAYPERRSRHAGISPFPDGFRSLFHFTLPSFAKIGRAQRIVCQQFLSCAVAYDQSGLHDVGVV